MKRRGKVKGGKPGKEGPAKKMYYVLVLKDRWGKLEIKYSEEHPEIIREDQKLAYYEAYRDKKEAICRKNSLKLYGNAWAQLKRRIKKSLK